MVKFFMSFPPVSTLHELPFPPGSRLAVAFGVFDGMHRGHRRILSVLRELADAVQGQAVAITFEPHPKAVLSPDNAPPLLTPLPLKVELLEGAGVDAVVVMPFTRELAALTPEAFLNNGLLNSGFNLRAVCVGAGWRFGHLGRGDTALLREFGHRHGFRVEAVPEVLADGGIISSTRIRTAVRQGRLELAARLLGHPYVVEGPVVRGRGLADAKLNCPTANVDYAGQLLPPSGVYAVQAWPDPEQIQAGDAAASRGHAGIAYIGTGASLAAKLPPQVWLECHLFDYDGKPLVGRRLRVEFLEFIRPDQNFPNVAALKTQIAQDLAAARTVAATAPSRTVA